MGQLPLPLSKGATEDRSASFKSLDSWCKMALNYNEGHFNEFSAVGAKF